MAIPKAVQDQANRSEELLQQMRDKEEGKTGDKPDGEKPADAKPDNALEAQKPDDGFQHKYEVLQAKYNAEVPQLHRQLRESSQALEDMQRQIDELKAAPKAPVDPGVDFSSLDDDYPPEIVSIMKQQAMTIAELRNEINDIKGSVNSTHSEVAKTREDAFWEAFSKGVPDSAIINTDPGFVEWMNSIDPMSGFTRQQLMDRAAQQLNAVRVIAIYDQWKNQKPSGYTPPDMANNLSPSASKGNGASAPEKPTYTRTQIKQFYEDWRSARTKPGHDEAKWVAKDHDITSAYAEGRITG